MCRLPACARRYQPGKVSSRMESLLGGGPLVRTSRHDSISVNQIGLPRQPHPTAVLARAVFGFRQRISWAKVNRNK